MAAPRNTSFRALKQLSSVGGQVRQLHITGPSTFPSHILNAEKSLTGSLPKDLAGLRAECKKRGLKASGNKSELVERLNKDAVRAYSSKRSAPENNAKVNFSATPVKNTSTTTPQDSNVARSFNTTRETRAPNDSSTIDFMYMPSFPLTFTTAYDDADPNSLDPFPQIDVPTDPFGITPWHDSSSDTIIRVPILPSTMDPVRASKSIEGDLAIGGVQLPSITTNAADGTFVQSPMAMAEASDGSGEAMHEVVTNEMWSWDWSLKSLFGGGSKKKEDKEGSVFGELWAGMMDDIFGQKKSSTG